MASKAGLSGLQVEYITDMNSLIYDPFTEDEFKSLAQKSLLKYEHNDLLKNYIMSLYKIKERVCATFTQFMFSFGHTSTQRGRGFNNVIKGAGSLKKCLAVANMLQLLNRMDTLVHARDVQALEILKELRMADKKWSDYYQKHLDVFAIKSATKIKKCVLLQEDNNNEYKVMHQNETNCHVDLCTKIVHLGHVYTVPTCQCGDWKSFLIICPCIICCLTASSQNVYDVKNVHLLRLLQQHPMWAKALKSCNLEDYEDFSHLRIHTEATTQPASTNHSHLLIGVMPSKYWN